MLLYVLLQVMELQEACQIHQGLVHGRTNSLHDMKAIVKTWRNRLPVIADDLSHWSDIFTWRQHHYQFIVDHYTDSGEHQVGPALHLYIWGLPVLCCLALVVSKHFNIFLKLCTFVSVTDLDHQYARPSCSTTNL